jgi:hypothetical protein
LLVLLFGGLVVLALLAKAGCERLGLPPLVAHIVLGLALRYGDEQYGMLAAHGREILGFLASVGVSHCCFAWAWKATCPGWSNSSAMPCPSGRETLPLPAWPAMWRRGTCWVSTCWSAW